MMKITKQQFAYILGLLEEEDIVAKYQFTKYNSILIWDIDGYDVEYKFDDNDLLINPEINKIQKQIDDLQNQIKELETEKNKLIKK